MSDQRAGGISWTEETWNPIRGCTRVSPGCMGCYAERLAATRLAGPGGAYEGLAKMTSAGPRWTGVIRTVPDLLEAPLRWTRPRRVFVNSMSDLFHAGLDRDFLDRIVLVMALAGRHTFQVLTKRGDRMAAYLTDRELPARLGALYAGGFPEGSVRRGTVAAIDWPSPDATPTVRLPLPNVWWGVSAENQATLDERLPQLLACRPAAAVLWLSLEPLLGPVNLWHAASRYCPQCRGIREAQDSSEGGIWAPCPCERLVGIRWVVVGGESGPLARPTHPNWVRQVHKNCTTSGVRFHFKQWGEWDPDGGAGAPASAAAGWLSPDGTFLEGSVGAAGCEAATCEKPLRLMVRAGRARSGRRLDGLEHLEYPEVTNG